ncbi:MAG: two-component system sensor histidine kinase QseC, partial [Oleiphilaceae bacterium]
MLKITSIKNFLIIAIISIISFVWVVSSSIIFNKSQEQVEELFDAELAQLSRMLQAVITTNIKLSTNSAPQPLTYLDKQIFDDAFGHQEYNERGHKYEKKLAFQVWDTKGQLFFENHIQLPKSFGDLKAGFHTVTTSNLKWRSFTLKDEDYGFWIKVAQREDVRTELTNEIAWNTTWPSLAIIPILMLILGWVIQKGLSPLRIISDE